MEEKYLIYKINNSQFNREPDYIFKSSYPMAQVAIDIDQNGPEHPLQYEEAYFDGCHLQCVGCKTFALFVYHPAMQHILRSATTDVKNESTLEISLFWKLFNEVLGQIIERDYTFNPKAIIVDENGASYCTIRKVFSVKFVKSEVVNCQMHYKNDVNKVCFSIGLSYRDIFKSICYKMQLWHSTTN